MVFQMPNHCFEFCLFQDVMLKEGLFLLRRFFHCLTHHVHGYAQILYSLAILSPGA